MRVTKEEFEEFLKNYSKGKLTKHVVTIAFPHPRCFSDFDNYEGWDAIVAKAHPVMKKDNIWEESGEFEYEIVERDEI
ncbi:MAG: hypothetical protein HRU26_09030 [Psychroserpens sp.]|nr:hypothetical protein [Psychroserpens sp.]